MPVNIRIPDANLVGFSDPAKVQVEETVDQFANDLLSEANRLEAANRNPAAAPDVSAQMVRDACTFVRRAMVPRPTSVKTKATRALAAILALWVGVAWDKTSLQDGTYLVTFGALFAIALLTVTLVSIKD